MSGEGISGKHNRRDFVKYSGGLLALAGLSTKAGKLAANVPGPSSVVDDQTDYPIINTTNNLENITVREVRDHSISTSYVGLPIVADFNDDVGGAMGWDLLDSSIPQLNPVVSGSNLYTDSVPSDLAEQFYTLDYRGRHDPAKPAGMTHTIEDQIDRYKTDLTITYVENGDTKTETINIPNIAAKQIFGWDLEQPLEWDEFLSYSKANQPVEFEAAMDNLYQVLSDQGLEDSIIQNRNTPLPPLADPNPWYARRDKLIDLSEDPMSIDDLYPTGVTLQMTDYSKK